MVLEQANQPLHSLAQELTILRLYLDLEALRFGDSFRYSIDMDKQIEPTHYQVPTLLLQPLAENAIRHGLLHQTGLRRLRVQVRSPEMNTLICVIEDNGIGRERAATQAQSPTNVPNPRTAKGIALTHERLSLLETSGFSTATLTIEDLPVGTLVTVLMVKGEM
jgi:LytS/YehU family sensor histidine kinase